MQKGERKKKKEIKSEFVFPCWTGEILQEEQPLSTAVCEAAGDFRQESERKASEEEGDARGPSPDVEARQDVTSILGDYLYRTHVAPRTKLFVPKDDLPIPMNYIDVQRRAKTNLDVLHEASMIIGILMEKSLSEARTDVTRFALLN